jgi:hypothetical protein
MPLKIYNTLSREKELFTPLTPDHVGMYVCGPTVYSDVHLGNCRTFISFDIIYRYLVYLGYKVRYVRNITDAGHLEGDRDEGDDKFSKLARLQKVEPMEIVQKYTLGFHHVMQLLNSLPPSIEPTATGHIAEQIEITKQILANGYAYEVNGTVYFDVEKYNQEQPYGILTNRKMDDLLEGTRELSGQDEKLLEKKADSVYQLLKKGEDFGKMAKWFSDDRTTYGNNGEIAEFGSGKYDISFENEVFKLAKDNEISRPFLTPFGYHIVKRLSQSPVSADKTDQSYQFELKQKVQQDARVNSAKELFVKEILKQVNYKKTGAVTDAELYRYADSVIANPNSETGNAAVYPMTNKIIYSFAKTKLTGRDWLDFVRSYKGSGELYRGETNAALVDKFISSTILDYYKKHLEDYNVDFRYQMEEFKDGNVLFEIMERNIWGKASNDMNGLQKHYNENKSKYLWAASANIILFNAASKAIADEARASLIKGKDWKKIEEESNNNIQADSGRFELSQIPVTIDPKMPAGTISETILNPDGNAGFIKLIHYYDANMQRNFDEARGLVINDYQNILEESWITDLKNKYPVKINEAVFQSLLK